MKTELNTFFTSSLSTALGNLKADSNAQWGTMTAKQILIHLTQSSKMMHLGNTRLVIKEKHIEKAIAFLYTDKPIAKGIKMPKDIGYNSDDGIVENIEDLKIQLIDSTKTMFSFLSENSDFKAIHPFFGELNTEQWLIFQRKHFTYHLSQFNLL